MSRIFRILLLTGIFIGISCPAGAEVINWWDSSTSESRQNVFEVKSDDGGLRLDNFTTGSISGTVNLATNNTWAIDFFVGTDEAVNRDPTDKVEIYINNQLISTILNDPVLHQHDINYQITGNSFDFEFQFTSSYALYDVHQWIGNGNATIANPVPEPETMLLFGFGLIGIVRFSRRRKEIQ